MPQRTILSLTMGGQALPLGELVHIQNGRHAFSQFSYDPTWLKRPKTQAMSVSPELALVPGPQIHMASVPGAPSVFRALGDTAPGPWARKVIDCTYHRALKSNPALAALDEIQYLCAVNETYRLGALRLVRPPMPWWNQAHGPTATLADLPQAVAASFAIGRGRELAADFQFLMDHGTSLGGTAPKVSLLDADGHLSLAKLPLMRDNLDALRSEMLAIELAGQSGINTVSARLHEVEHRGLVLLIKRFDRTAGGGRKHHISATTLLQAGLDEDITYLDLLSAMRGVCADFATDAQQLWRRLVFNLLITHVDDGLHKIGFLYAGGMNWQLAPAYGLSPQPDRERVLPLPLTRQTGQVRSVRALLDHAEAFELSTPEALEVLAQITSVIKTWRNVARASPVGLYGQHKDRLGPAFEHEQLKEAMALCA